jgi:Ca2+-binding RTX toxin-like protein
MSNNWDSLLTARHDATPMLLDMLAIQHVYGANTSYHTGDDTYSLDFPLNTTKAVREAIWDAGGTDTIDASHYLAGSSGITLDLTPGSVNQFYPLSEFSIAYGVTIENVVGSPYNDTLNGNDANNRIDGGAGSDVMHGGPGDDTYVVDSASDIVNESAGEGTDTVSSSVSYSLAANVENLTLTGTAPNALGNDIANVLTGNAGNNSLFGAGGDDVLVYTGGADTLDGGMGFDTAMVMFGHAAASTLTASSFTIAGQTTTLTGIEARAFLEVNHGGTFVPGQAYYQDINGDGRVDLTLENDSLQFWLSDGNASGLDAPSLAFQHGGTSGFIVNQTQFADINGDGHQDALFQGIDNRFWVSASDGTRFGNPVLAAVVTHDDFNTAQVRYADMNGDGKADMMYQGDGKGDIIYQKPDHDFYLAISGSDWTVA